MKRIFALLLVLTLFCPSALAETIRQQVNAPESLQDTFTSNTGRMTIDIKADVIVPDISTLYEIDVTPRLFNDEELSRLVKGFQQTDSQLDARNREALVSCGLDCHHGSIVPLGRSSNLWADRVSGEL